MKKTDRCVEDGGLDHFAFRDRENVTDEHVFQVLGFAGGFAHEQDGGGGSDGVSDTDEGFLRNVAAAAPRDSENGGTEKGEAETDPVRGAPMGVHADDDGDGCAKGSNLRQGKIHKDDAALDDVHAEIGVDAGEDEAGDKGQNQECENFHAMNFPLRAVLLRKLSGRCACAASFGGVQSLLEFGDIVVEQLEIIGDLFFAADAGHENDNLATGVARDGVRCFQIEVWLDDDDLYSIAFHLSNQFYGMLRAGRNSGARFDVPDNIEAEVFREVGPRAVIGDDFAAGGGVHLRKPLLIGLLQALLKTGIALREISRVAGAHFAEFVGYALGEAQTVFRIEPVLRISERVDVAFGASALASGDFKNFRITRG